MATHSSILVWKIPWTEVPHRLQSTGLQRVRHDSATEHTRQLDGRGGVDDHEYYYNDLLVNYYNSTKWIILLLPLYRKEN